MIRMRAHQALVYWSHQTRAVTIVIPKGAKRSGGTLRFDVARRTRPRVPRL